MHTNGFLGKPITEHFSIALAVETLYRKKILIFYNDDDVYDDAIIVSTVGEYERFTRLPHALLGLTIVYQLEQCVMLYSLGCCVDTSAVQDRRFLVAHCFCRRGGWGKLSHFSLSAPLPCRHTRDSYVS